MRHFDYVLTLLISLLGVLIGESTKAQTMYVTPTGAGNQSGQSWQNALPESQFVASLSVATAGTIFKVATGLFRPVSNTDITNRTRSFYIPSGVRIYGGYEAGTNNRTTNPSSTTFSGEIGSPASTTDNSLHVVEFRNASVETILDGIVITGGYNFTLGQSNGGAGIYNDGSGIGNRSNPMIQNCWLTDNSGAFGGAIWNKARSGGEASPSILYCVFENNQASRGGAICNDSGEWIDEPYGNSSPVIRHCLFRKNKGFSGGGAIYNHADYGISSPFISRCSFDENGWEWSGYNGGAISTVCLSGTSLMSIDSCQFNANKATGGGAISVSNYLSIEKCRPVLTNCIFTNNIAGSGGGGIYLVAVQATLRNVRLESNRIDQYGNNFNTPAGGGGVYILGSSVSFERCSFVSNITPWVYAGGGGILSGNSQVTFLDCLFEANKTGNSGGGICNSNTNSTLLNCRFIQNQSGNNNGGGGLYNDSSVGSGNLLTTSIKNSVFYKNITGSIAGAISSHIPIELLNCTIVENEASDAGGVYTVNSLSVVNSILRNNRITQGSTIYTSTNVRNYGGVVSYAYSNIEDTPPQPAPGVINADPVFSNSSAGDLRLRPESPCYNAGNPMSTTATVSKTDLGGNPRIAEGRIDMGAYEIPIPVPATIIQQPAVLQTVCAGSVATFTVVARGTNLRYQWSKGSIDNLLTGQTSATLTLLNSRPSDTGIYFCWITGDEGNVLTHAAMLSVTPGCTLFATPSGAGSRSGLDWENALSEIEFPVTLASAQPGIRFLLSAGIFRPTSNTTLRTASFQIPSGVQVLGGYEAGTNNRQLKPSSTTLSGAIMPNLTVRSSHVVVFRNADPTTLLDGVVIKNGFASYYGELRGGGIFNDGSGVGNQSSPRLNNCLITDNLAAYGAGMYNNAISGGNCSPVLTNCDFLSNIMIEGGAGIYNKAPDGTCSLSLVNCRFQQNSPSIYSSYVGLGGAMNNQGNCLVKSTNCLYTDNAGYHGGAIFAPGSSMTFVNCTFTRNSSLYEGYVLYGSASQFLNCIIWGNLPLRATNRSVYTDEGAAYNYTNTQDGIPTSGTGNISQNPLFVSTQDSRLDPNSPCIDTGNPNSGTNLIGHTDLWGNVRLQNGRVDMGAYEWQSCSAMSTIQNGQWDQTNTWSCPRLPMFSDSVTIRHIVVISPQYQAVAGQINYIRPGSLLFNLGSRLQLNVLGKILR